jgi:flagella basal body P-ring formation protein FlgA
MLRLATLGFFMFSVPAVAETLVAARTIRSQAILTDSDLSVIAKTIPGALQFPDEAIGLETRVVLYAGRAIRPSDIGPPAIIERNQVVTLIFRRGSLTIAADARSLGRGGIGDAIRVMNLSSRSTVTGIVQSDGTLLVGGPDISRFK